MGSPYCPYKASGCAARADQEFHNNLSTQAMSALLVLSGAKGMVSHTLPGLLLILAEHRSMEGLRLI